MWLQHIRCGIPGSCLFIFSLLGCSRHLLVCSCGVLGDYKGVAVVLWMVARELLWYSGGC